MEVRPAGPCGSPLVWPNPPRMRDSAGRPSPALPRRGTARTVGASTRTEELVGVPEYSLVLPACDEAETIPELIRRLRDVIERLDGPAEVVFVDDGSTDATFELLVDATRTDPRFRVVQLSRNFGHQAAITAGLDFARGRAVSIMDADLQDPPELILDLAAKWREGYTT